MSLTAVEFETKLIGTMPPVLRKGSHSALVLPQGVADGFVAGPENAPLVECLHPDSVAALNERSPVMLVGPSGSGKTVMAATLAGLWLNEDSQRRITLTSATEFSRSLTRSIKADDMDRFRQVHRDVDCLVLDNIQELVSKPVAQEEFTATLDHLFDRGRLVVLTASDIPLRIAGLSRGLLSRLSFGHSVLMRLPGNTARGLLLERIATHQQLAIDRTTLREIDSQLPEDLTALQLRGVLLRWMHHERAHGDGTGRPSRGRHRILETPSQPAPSAHEIVKAVARESRMPVDLLVGPSRKSSVVRARGLAMVLIRQLTMESYESIGGFFSGRDHTTVMHACKKTEADLPSDPELGRMHDRIRQRFQRMG